MKDNTIIAVLLAACFVGGLTLGYNIAAHEKCEQALTAEKQETEKYRKEVMQLEEKIANLQPNEEHEKNIKVYDALPLNSELQKYTYEQCVAGSCDDYYEIVLAIMWQESNFKANAISVTNDYGIMQINKINHKTLSAECGITDFLDAKQNIKAGVHHLSKLVDKYEEPHAVLMAYNLGESGAKAKWRQGIYSTSYSSSVMEKKDMVKKNLYE